MKSLDGSKAESALCALSLPVGNFCWNNSKESDRFTNLWRVFVKNISAPLLSLFGNDLLSTEVLLRLVAIFS